MEEGLRGLERGRAKLWGRRVDGNLMGVFNEGGMFSEEQEEGSAG